MIHTIRATLLACAVLVHPGAAEAVTVFLNPGNNFTYEVEPGAFISIPGNLGPSPNSGDLAGTNVLFASPSVSNTFYPSTLRRDGFPTPPFSVIQFDLLLTVLVTSSGNTYTLDLLSYRRAGTNCIDANSGASCAAANNFTSFELTPNAVPLPAALPLFATGLGLIGLLSWRRKKRLAKQMA